MKKIYFLSASDRLNYGDLLFPIIFKVILKKYTGTSDFSNVAIIKSNLEYFGALKTISYKEFQKNIADKGGVIIIGGGEVLYPRWHKLYSFISFNYSRVFNSNTLNKIFNPIGFDKNTFLGYFLSYRNMPFPFTPSLNKINNNNVKVLYNAVGGASIASTINENRIIKDNMKGANFVSVRDKRTYDRLNNIGVGSIISPDSALIMSDFLRNRVLL
jgi:hypothetical protein